MAKKKARLHGLLLVDKAAGGTSHDVVVQARRILREKKIGHCGTLDPDATGLLLLTVGRATRLTRFLIRAPKVYEGSVRFGLSTDTYDLSGEVTDERSADGLDLGAVRSAMEGLEGTSLQSPPPYCAKKVGGQKYYELARRGEEVPDEKKEITVYELRPLVDTWTPDEDLPFLLSCASGTYARSIAHDLGEGLGPGGTLASLRRTRIGGFGVDDALTLETLRERLHPGEEPSAPPEEDDLREELGGAWIPFDDIPLPFGEVVTDAQQERRIQHGQDVLVRDLEGDEGDWIKVLNQRHQFIAVGFVAERIGAGNVGIVQPKVVFH